MNGSEFHIIRPASFPCIVVRFLVVHEVFGRLLFRSGVGYIHADIALQVLTIKIVPFSTVIDSSTVSSTSVFPWLLGVPVCVADGTTVTPGPKVRCTATFL